MAFQYVGLNQTSADNGDDITSQHPTYIALREKRKLINTLLGGNSAMRAAPEYLPSFPKEDPVLYSQRLARSYLNPALSIAIEKHASKPFSQPIFTENLSTDARLTPLVTNTDGEGNNLTEFAKRVFTDADSFGLSYILSDFSKSDAKNKADDLRGSSARLIHVKALDLFYWDNTVINGETILTEIRYYQDATVSNGEFGKKQVKQIKRWTRDSWQVWQKTAGEDVVSNETTEANNRLVGEDEEWRVVDSGKNTLGEIPLTTCYFKRTGFMRAIPPNMELAETSLEYWQDYSDQKSLEKLARVGILFAKAFEDGELDNFVVSGNNLLISESESADLSIVEPTGASVTVGRDSLNVLSDRMEELSLKPMIQRSSGDVTATEVGSNNFNQCTDLQSWGLALQDSLVKSFEMAYKWIGATLEEEAIIRVYNDYVIVGNSADIPVLVDMFREGILDQETVLIEIKRRATLDESAVVEDIIARTKAESEEKMENEIKVANAMQPTDADGVQDNEGDSGGSGSSGSGED